MEFATPLTTSQTIYPNPCSSFTPTNPWSSCPSNLGCSPQEFCPPTTNKLYDYVGTPAGVVQKTKYIGWEDSYPYEQWFGVMFSPQNINNISKRITQLLEGVDPQGRSIIIPDHSIIRVMSATIDAYKPQIGDIYSRYTMFTDPQDVTKEVILRTVNTIVGQTKTEADMVASNQKLTKWTTVLGEFNEHGLRSHAPLNKHIRSLRRRPTPMQFNMVY